VEECPICKKYHRLIAEEEANHKKIAAPKRNDLMRHGFASSALKYALERHRKSMECTER